jgi:hypothetical protein
MGKISRKVHDGERQEEATQEVSGVHERQDLESASASALNWEELAAWVIQMQEHIDTLTSQDLSKPARKALDGLTKSAAQVLPVLLTEARRERAR